MTNDSKTVSRRSVLQASAGLMLAATLPIGGAKAARPRAGVPVEPNAFLKIGPDNTITVMVKHIEFGQGPMTGLATLVAEEMDAEWSQMRAEHAPSNPRIYKNTAFGMQGTGGSTAMFNSYTQMRKVGAIARAMLVQAAADAWKVPAKEITVEAGVIKHARSGKSGPFGAFADAAAKMKAPKDAPLKKASDFKLIGKEGAVKRLDMPDKTTGAAQFTMDIREPGMLTVVVARPERFGGKLKSFDATETKAVKGVVAVKSIGNGVAVYAENTWAAIKGRSKLKVVWDDAKAEKRGTEQIIKEFQTLARKPGLDAGKKGDAAGALKKAEKVIEAEYVFPLLAHAPMEPLDGYINWDGTKAHVRMGSQIQTLDHMTMAKILGTDPKNINLETVLAGGSFGRRAQFSVHFAIELASAAKAIGPNRPIKLIWTREDDIRGGYYRPLFVHRMRGAVKDGKITAWSNTIVGQSFVKGTVFERFLIEKSGVDRTMVEGARDMPYDIANFKCDLHIADVGVPTLWWRSVGHTHTGYAVECFVDQLLVAAGQDPVDGRLALMKGHPRSAAVLREVAKMADWKNAKPAKGRALGVAVVESFRSYVAQIAEVSFDEEDGPRVHKVWCAVDCGTAVNPDIIKAQMEGGIGYGLGHVLYGEIGLEDGKVVPNNFDTYRSLRINEMPEVEVKIMSSTAPPTGVGEPGVPPIGPAVANALARLGNDRPSRHPMVREEA